MKVKVTKMNLGAEAVRKAAKDPLLGVFISEADVADIPDEQSVWIDTKHIVAIFDPLPGNMGQGSFTVQLDRSDGKTIDWYIKNDCYDGLLNAWMNE